MSALFKKYEAASAKNCEVYVGWSFDQMVGQILGLSNELDITKEDLQQAQEIISDLQERIKWLEEDNETLESQNKELAHYADAYNKDY